MNLDNRVTQLNSAVYQRLEALRLQPEQLLEAEQARDISAAMLADGEVSADELDLVNEILGQQAQASRSEISVSSEETPIEPLELMFQDVRPGARAAFERVRSAAEAAPADWGDVTIAERQNNIQELSALATRLAEQEVPGVELWGQLTDAAVAQYADAQVSGARKADFAMQDLGMVILGPMAMGGLDAYDRMTGWMPGKSDPLVDTFRRDFQALGLPPADRDWRAAGHAGMHLDRNHGQDFRPEINDGTDNQIYHSFFYQYETYVTGDPSTVHAGSVFHETIDGGLFKPGGKTSEDHNASFVGIPIGLAMRNGRNSENPEHHMAQWGEMTQAAYGRGGGPEVRAGNASQAAQKTHETISEFLETGGGTVTNAIWASENFIIDNIVGPLGRLFGG